MPTYTATNISGRRLVWEGQSLGPNESFTHVTEYVLDETDLKQWRCIGLELMLVAAAGAPSLSYRIQDDHLQLQFGSGPWISTFGVADLAKAIVKTYMQIDPLRVWTINHNLGRIPVVTFYTMGGSEIDGQLQNVDLNTLTVTFDFPVAGYATYI